MLTILKCILAAIAENYILILKRKLYMLLRGTLSQDWVSALKTVTKGLNNTPIQRLGWLKPSDINSEAGSVLVERAKKSHNIAIDKEPTYLEQRLNQAHYDGKLKVSDYVYKQFELKLFDKSFDVSVNQNGTLKNS